MVELTPPKVKILKMLSKSEKGLDNEYLISKIGICAEEMLKELTYEGLIGRVNVLDKTTQDYVLGNWVIIPHGQSVLIQYKATIKKQNFTKWGERIWGFITGIAVGIIVGYLLAIIGLSA